MSKPAGKIEGRRRPIAAIAKSGATFVELVSDAYPPVPRVADVFATASRIARTARKRTKPQAVGATAAGPTAWRAGPAPLAPGRNNRVIAGPPILQSSRAFPEETPPTLALR